MATPRSKIQYDKVGNRTSVKTHVVNNLDDDSGTETDSTFTYDFMNRQVKEQDTHQNGKVESFEYGYDHVGNRVTEIDTVDNTVSNISSTFDSLNRLTSTNSTENILDVHTYGYDGAGRTVLSTSFEKYQGDPTQARNTLAYHYTDFDSSGLALASRSVQRSLVSNSNIPITVLQVDTVVYSKTLNPAVGDYDAAGNLLGYIDTSDAYLDDGSANKQIVNTVSNTIARQHGQAQQTKIVTRSDVQDWSPGTVAHGDESISTPGQWNYSNGPTTVTATNQYDANGFLVKHSENDPLLTRTFVNNVQGMAVVMNQGSAQGDQVANPASKYLGGYIGTPANPGYTSVPVNPANASAVQRQLVVNGEALARYGVSLSTDGLKMNRLESTLDVSLNAQPLSGGNGTSMQSTYTVQRGETLQSIARAVYGDARLWYRLADTNGLSDGSDSQLTQGLTLTIPKLTSSSNSVDTFKPYDPSKITGNLGPTLPPLPAPAQDAGCGAYGADHHDHRRGGGDYLCTRISARVHYRNGPRSSCGRLCSCRVHCQPGCRQRNRRGPWL